MPPQLPPSQYACMRSAEIDHHTEDIYNLYGEVKILNTLVTSGITGLRRDVQNVTTLVGEMKADLKEQSGTIQTILQKQESCVTKDLCAAKIEKCGVALEPYKKQVDRHTIYFGIIGVAILALWAWVSGYFDKLLGWG